MLKVPRAHQIRDYAVRVVLATHPENQQATALSKQFMRYGASPRGLQAIILAAKIRALLEGRDYATPYDVKRTAPDVLRHRIVLSYEAEADGVRPEQIVDAVLAAVETP